MSLIGSPRDCAGNLFRSSGLARFQTILTPKDFRTIAQQTGCAPEKDRPLIPEVVCWLMMIVALHTQSMTQGLLVAWGWVRSVCPRLPVTSVTEEAFCQARRDLPLSFWKALWHLLGSRYEQQFDAGMRWKGLFRVLAADGSEVILPKAKALIKFFGCPKGRHGTSPQPQGRLVAMCSVFTGFCLAFKFVALKVSEHAALRHLIRLLQGNDLLLLDRGFFSYAAIWLIRLRNAHYLIRLSRQMVKHANRTSRLGPDEWMVRFRPIAQSCRKCPGLPGELICRLIRYQQPGFRHSWLVTSLMQPRRYTREDLVHLYHQRWTVETIYREWKHTLDIQNLRSHTPAGILKEVYAQLMLSNLVRWIMTEATQDTDHSPLNYSFVTTLTLVKVSVARMIQAGDARIPWYYQQLLADIRAAKIRKRPGRSYPRPKDGTIKDKGSGRLQLPSRIIRKLA